MLLKIKSCLSKIKNLTKLFLKQFFTFFITPILMGFLVFLKVKDHLLIKVKSVLCFDVYNLINNPKKFNVGIDDLGAKPCIPHKSLLQ